MVYYSNTFPELSIYDHSTYKPITGTAVPLWGAGPSVCFSLSVKNCHRSFPSQYLELKRFFIDDNTVPTMTPPTRLKLVTFNQLQNFCGKLRAEELLALLSSEEMWGKRGLFFVWKISGSFSSFIHAAAASPIVPCSSLPEGWGEGEPETSTASLAYKPKTFLIQVFDSVLIFLVSVGLKFSRRGISATNQSLPW